MKKNLHPKLIETKVICGGIQVGSIKSIVDSIKLDIWAGNHPLYTGTARILDMEGRLEKFNKRYNKNKNFK